MGNINEAVNTLREYCGSFKKCEDGCRFYDGETGCMFFEELTPEEWEVKS